MSRKATVQVVVDKDDIVSSLRSIAVAFMNVADEIENVITDPWQPISTALKNGKTILVRVAGGEHDPFAVYYDRTDDVWRDSKTFERVFPNDYVGPLEWRHLS